MNTPTRPYSSWITGYPKIGNAGAVVQYIRLVPHVAQTFFRNTVSGVLGRVTR